jgi:hypothetical protein
MINISLKELKKDPVKAVEGVEFEDVFIYDKSGDLQAVMLHPNKYEQLNHALEELGEIDNLTDSDDQSWVDRELGF